MPVDFLTTAQEQRYGRFAGEPTWEQLAKYFHLDETDRRRISRRHRNHNKLGFAVQLATVRFLGTFLAQPTEVPSGAVTYLARQLEIPDPDCLRQYRDDARWRHVLEIRESDGYRELGDPRQVFHLVRWLYTRASLSAEGPSVLFDHATRWLVEQKILLPGVTTLARLVARIRERAAARLWRTLSEIPSTEQRIQLQSLNAGPNPRYFGTGRGVTYLNFTSDQFIGFSGLLIPGMRDSIYILEGLLQNETSLRPVQIMTDTASYSDLVFGLFRLLGYQFSPRLTDLGAARFWRLDRSADYGPLNALARHHINPKLIRTHWEDMLRVAGSLAFGNVKATERVRALQGGGRPTALGRALAEYGRISKTLHLLHVIDDESYRRQILIQLNRQEGRHSLARATFHGKKGEIRQPYREGQEDQLGLSGSSSTQSRSGTPGTMDVALDQLRAEGNVLQDEDIARLSSLVHEHINLHGRYYFGLTEALQRGELRALRDPRNAMQEL